MSLDNGNSPAPAPEPEECQSAQHDALLFILERAWDKRYDPDIYEIAEALGW